MADLWKQILYPTTVASGDDYLPPFVNVNNDGETVLMDELITGTTGAGPYPLTGFFVGFDFFGDQNTSQHTIATSSIPDSSALSAFKNSNSFRLAFPGGVSGAAAFFVANDGSGHWTINSDVITPAGEDTFTQTLSVVDATIPDTDTILGVFSPAPHGGPSAGEYGVGYAVLDNSGNIDLLWQGYNADGSKANTSPVSLVGGPQTAPDSDPAGWVNAGGGAFVDALEFVNGGGGHYIHFQSFNVDGTLNTAIGSGNTGHFDLNVANTNVDDITQIRFVQFPSSSPGNSASTFAVVDSEHHSDDGKYHVVFRFDHSGTVTPTNFTLSTTPQQVTIDTNPTDGTTVIAWGDKGSGAHGATIAEFDSNGAEIDLNGAAAGDTFSIDDGAFKGISLMGDGRLEVVFSKTIDGPTNTTQDVIDIVDLRTAGQTINDSAVTGVSENDIAGTIGNDVITGSDTDFDKIDGAAGSDKFVFDAAAFTAANSGPHDEIMDYDQGNTGQYSAAEGDQIDISGIVQTALTGGQPVSSLMHVFDDGDKGTFLVVDSDGAANGTSHVPLVQLDGIHAGQTVDIIDNSSVPAGVTLGVESDQGFAGNFNPGTDSVSDLVWVNDANGAIRLFELDGNSSGNQVLANLAIGKLPSGWHIGGIGDFNGDGTSDILLQDVSGAQKFWEMNSNVISESVKVNGLKSGFHVEGIGDFNNDGISDAILQNDNGTVNLWEFNGASSGSQLLANLRVGNLTSDFHIVGTGDFNGDGVDDILLRNDNGTVRLWELNGSASAKQLLANLAVNSLTTDWHLEGVGDFNKDGISDILLRNDTGAVRLWELTGAASGQQIKANVAVTTLTASQHIIGTGDFNGDGIDDIAVRDDSGATSVIELNAHPSGGQILATQTVAPTLSADWATANHHFDIV